MNHLSGMDATFLHLETPEMPMHVGGLNILELPPGYTGDLWEDIKAHIGSRLHLAPMFTRKLALMPFELADPVWVDDDDVDLDYHVRRVVLPRPGTREQLDAYVGRLHSSLLDRSRPLWECYVIEGLQSGQAAFYTKAHHAGMDGAAGAVMAQAIFDATAQPRAVRPPPARRRASHDYQLGVAELAGAAMKNTAMQYLKLMQMVPAAAKVFTTLTAPTKTEGDGKPVPALPRRMRLGPRTRLNVAITNQRVFAGKSMPLADAKWIAKQAGATVNDVVLTVCAGALRAYLERFGELPKKPLMAGVPVSLRESGNTDMNNQATAMVVNLATDVADPVERLKAIHASSVDSKQFTGHIKAVILMDYPTFGAPWLLTGFASMIGRTKLVNALPPVSNLVISNVPGPQTPLYLAGCQVVTNYPLSIPAHGMAMNLTVQSYNGSLDFGISACRRAVPDAQEVAELLAEAMAELKAAMPAAAPAAQVSQAAQPADAVAVTSATTASVKRAAAAKRSKRVTHAD